MIKANDHQHGFDLCQGMLELGGLGHTAVIHTEDEDLQVKFGLRMKACRVLVNLGASNMICMIYYTIKSQKNKYC